MSAKKLIGNIIQERRNQLRITQEQLADMAQLGINTLYKIEKGEANPTLSPLGKIVDVLGLEITLNVKDVPGLRNETGKNILSRPVGRGAHTE